MNERVAVIIPYYQRKPGLLARAIRSVFHQHAAVDPWIIVVDDSSPWPARVEIDTLDARARETIRLIWQPNSGAGHARNTAINAIPPDVEFVALLDPDDTWEDDHLDQAMLAMRLGYDFYFCDVRSETESTGYFARCGLAPVDHTALRSDSDLYGFAGDFFDQSLRHSPVSTSSVVMRRSRLGHLRFSDWLRPVGEDLLFWLDVARETNRIAFSARTSLIYGEGVSGSWSKDWATAKSLTIVNAYTNYYDEVGRRFDLTPSQDQLVRDRIRLFQGHFVYTLFGMLKRRRWPNPALVGRYLVRNPRLPVIVPLILATKLIGRKS